ncbi:hypothetical protein [Zhongshania marina]|uniref:Uncharacterized protein n=1 Tax=Zhongshania marina TaxID=2304603 RepID=A0ABX9W2U3_9GAMM|nr:hypothetical protein D0911_12190 [Zhongshania marina]
MEQFKKVDHEKEAKKYRTLALLFIGFYILIPILALMGAMKPESEALGIWFQRSGSVMVLFASIAEFFSVKMHGVFNPAHLTNEPLFNTKLKFSLQSFKLMAVSAVLIGLGTLIWGYGDIFVKSA